MPNRPVADLGKVAEDRVAEDRVAKVPNCHQCYVFLMPMATENFRRPRLTDLQLLCES